MSDAGGYTQLDDADFFAERRRVREEIALLPEADPGRARLAQVYEELTDELVRRARVAWSQPTE